jgi:magnesium-transporting ATPase (P-type)
VTGYVDYKIKGTIILDDIKNDMDKTNILYQKSYIVEGSGRAVACAIGIRTQSGMPQNVFQEQTLKEERSKFKEMLGSYSKQLGKYTNYIVVILFVIILYH